MAASLISVPSSGGAAASYALAGNEAWQLVSVTATVAIVNPTNHVVPIVKAAAPAGEIVAEAMLPLSFVVGGSLQLRWGFGGLGVIDNSNPTPVDYLQAPLPLLHLAPGGTLTIRSEDRSGNLRVGDVLSSVFLWVDDGS